MLTSFISGVGKAVYTINRKIAGRWGRKLLFMFYGMAAGAMMGLPFSNGLAATASYFLDWKAALVLVGYLWAFSALPYLLTFRSIELLPASTAGAMSLSLRRRRSVHSCCWRSRSCGITSWAHCSLPPASA